MIQLGRKEYWIAATAVSPSYMYSSGSIIAGFTQPVPVVVATTSTLRLNAPVRSSSLTASADSASIDGAELRPAYTLIGSIAGFPVNRLISATVGPPATKVLPCLPSVSQGTSESGPPERIADVGLGNAGGGPAVHAAEHRVGRAERAARQRPGREQQEQHAYHEHHDGGPGPVRDDPAHEPGDQSHDRP